MGRLVMGVDSGVKTRVSGVRNCTDNAYFWELWGSDANLVGRCAAGTGKSRGSASSARFTRRHKSSGICRGRYSFPTISDTELIKQRGLAEPGQREAPKRM